jgi:hypothetical protein
MCFGGGGGGQQAAPITTPLPPSAPAPPPPPPAPIAPPRQVQPQNYETSLRGAGTSRGQSTQNRKKKSLSVGLNMGKGGASGANKGGINL